MVYFIINFFILGTILGSFYQVVGDRLPRGKSIVKPPSHCPNCEHRLTPLELIPIWSYLLQGGKCKNCKEKISIVYPLYELACGSLFALAYLSYGLTWDLLIVLTFISILLIIFVSDFKYMIISDEVLVVGGIFLFLEIWLIKGSTVLGNAIINGVIAFIIMFLIKQLGDWMFKKESMGGGDIKLLFFFGLIMSWQMSIVAIFLGSIIGLPISLFILYKDKSNIVPFGPFLSAGALIIALLQLKFDFIINLISI
ncbi:MAG: prepilin peptidase [Bacilli bacterium]|nr:prepilin peptidase [Bacilli bacterium]MDD4808962.1 prepilin peptidase [Bacilli bacterium]